MTKAEGGAAYEEGARKAGTAPAAAGRGGEAGRKAGAILKTREAPPTPYHQSKGTPISNMSLSSPRGGAPKSCRSPK